MAKERKYYFDMAKGIGIILVVMGHLEYISIPLRYFIASYHMPMFFVISGMLMCMTGEENKEVGRTVKGKLTRMAIPYLAFSILYLIIEIGYGYMTGTWNFWTWIQDLWLSICLYGISVLWFLPAMFFGFLLLYFLRKKTSHTVTIIAVVILTVIMYGLTFVLEYMKVAFTYNFIMSELYYPLAMAVRSFFAMAYLAVGYYTYYLLQRPSAILDRVRKLPRILGVVVSLVLLGIVAYLSQVNGAVDIHFLIFGNPLIYIFNSLAGSGAVILLCWTLEPLAKTIPCRILRYYGENSLIVMATHINSYILYCSIIVAMHVVKYVTRAKNYIFCTLILVIVFVSEIFVIEIINRFFPFFAGKGFKRKNR